MTLFSFIALAFGMAAATADRVQRPSAALIAVTRASRAAARPEQRASVPASFPAPRHTRVAHDHRPLRPIVPPLRGAAAPRAPGV